MEVTHFSSTREEPTHTRKPAAGRRILAFSPRASTASRSPPDTRSPKSDQQHVQAQSFWGPKQYVSDVKEKTTSTTSHRQKETNRERLKRHREEVAGRVLIPDSWSQEILLKDWIDYSSFDKLLFPNEIESARQALAAEGRRATSAQRFRTEDLSCTTIVMEGTRVSSMIEESNSNDPIEPTNSLGSSGCQILSFSKETNNSNDPSERQVLLHKDSGRERLERHREEVAGRVRVPDMWNQESLLGEWVDCSTFDKLLAPTGIAPARKALVGEGRRASSQRSSIEKSQAIPSVAPEL